ncbi:signal peptide peptidase SppA [Brucella sp.]|uniref:signal peptide peptidase SppA n=1 Tax=Brucella sp. TaxID=52132 RepID=UPI002896C3DB|nr:signal peptide peptidase SppA [Brucella sp.]
MKYQNILSAFAAEPWAIAPEKLEAMTAFLLFKAEGGNFSPDEVAARISNKRANELAKTEGATAVIPVYGVLAQRMDLMSEISGGVSYQSLKRSIHEALANDDVKAVVLDIDSPGGAVPGTDELASEIRALRGGDKPIIAQVNSLAASAAYWIASAADEIVVTPSGRAGSIGVYTSHDDVSAYLEKNGVKRTYISAGKYKVEGNEVEPLGEDARQFIQDRVDYSYRRFVEAVAEGRGVTKSKVEEGFGQGRVFFAQELLDRGMADRIATLDETLARYGSDATPQPIRRIKAANTARAQDADTLIAKIRAGEEVSKREFENGLKGLVGCSNSEAERAARLYLKSDQGEPDVDADAAVSAALDQLIAETKSFKI